MTALSGDTAPSPGQAELTTALAHFPGFEQATDAQLQAAVPAMTLQTLSGRTFIEEGTPSKAVYFLLEGRVELIRTLTDGSRAVVGVLAAPTVIGFAGVIKALQRAASVRARGPVTMLRLDAAAARELLLRDDDLSALLRRALLASLASQLSSANRLFAQLSTHSIARQQRQGTSVVL